jgi:hypothetical protein
MPKETKKPTVVFMDENNNDRSNDAEYVDNQIVQITKQLSTISADLVYITQAHNPDCNVVFQFHDNSYCRTVISAAQLLVWFLDLQEKHEIVLKALGEKL